MTLSKGLQTDKAFDKGKLSLLQVANTKAIKFFSILWLTSIYNKNWNLKQ